MIYSIRTVGPVGDAESIPVVLSLDEAKEHLRVDFGDDDDLISAYVDAAQDAIERHTGQVLTPRVMEMADWGFPSSHAHHRAGFWNRPEDHGRHRDSAITLAREPVTSIVSVAYTDRTGADLDLAEADWRWSESAPTLVRPAWGTIWPRAADEAGSVRVRFEAGYEDGLCPASLLTAVKLMVGHFYSNREEIVVDMRAAAVQLPLGVDRLCAPYRRVSL